MRGSRILMLAAAASVLAGCSDETAPTTHSSGKTAVLLTDAPFPYDQVDRVDVYIERIEASATADTTSTAQSWVTITEPKRTFNLLELQNGTTAILGESAIPGATYKAVRMTLDTDKSRVVGKNGANIPVAWQSSTGRPTLYAFVEHPMDIGTQGGSVVIDFDVGRSFLCLEATCNGSLTFSPVFRAVLAETTGSVSGVVRADATGQNQPIAGAAITVFRGNVSQPLETWWAVGTGRTDAQGRYKVAFLHPGTYVVRADPPSSSAFFSGEKSGVAVSAGQETSAQDITLAKGDVDRIDLSTNGATLFTFDTMLVSAVVRSAGGPVTTATVTWTSSNSSVIVARSAGPTSATIFAAGVGTAVVTASYRNKSASATFTVRARPEPGPVATVTVEPGTATAAVGDSIGFRARVRDANGVEIGNRTVTWTSENPAIARVEMTGGIFTVLRTLAAGTVRITASIEGKSGNAQLTVSPR